MYTEGGKKSPALPVRVSMYDHTRLHVWAVRQNKIQKVKKKMIQTCGRHVEARYTKMYRGMGWLRLLGPLQL